MQDELTFSWRSSRACIIAIVPVAVLGCGPPQEAAKPVTENHEPGAGSNAFYDTMAAQLPLAEVAELLRRSDGADEGLGGVRIRTPERTVDVWWKGPLGDAQRSIVEDANSRGIHINLATAKYSQTEMLAAMTRYRRGTAQFPENLAFIAPRVDGSGIEVGGTSELDIAQELGIDAYSVSSTRIEPQSRAADTPLWYGGAAIRLAGSSSTCSTGFAVNWGWSVDRAAGTGLVTAGHCGDPGGGHTFNTTAGRLVGVSFPRINGRSIVVDSLLIGTPSGSTARIYDGGVGVDEFSKPVVGSMQIAPGMQVCHSGAVSGAVCGLIVSRIKAQAFVGFTWSQSIAIATPAPAAAPITIVRAGDSGGPVFVLASDPSKVVAVGTVGGVAFLDCSDPSGSTCQQSLGFVDTDFLYVHNISLMTQ